MLKLENINRNMWSLYADVFCLPTSLLLAAHRHHPLLHVSRCACADMNALLLLAATIVIPLLAACTCMHVCCQRRASPAHEPDPLCRQHAGANTTCQGLYSKEPGAHLSAPLSPPTRPPLSRAAGINSSRIGELQLLCYLNSPGEAYLKSAWRSMPQPMPTPAHVSTCADEQVRRKFALLLAAGLLAQVSDQLDLLCMPQR